MKAELIDADDKHRARGGSIRSPQFWRMVALAWPHRRLIFLGLVASVGFAIFNALSVSGVVPLLKILLSEEGLHGWVDRAAAEAGQTVRADAGSPSEVGGEPVEQEVVSRTLPFHWRVIRSAVSLIPRDDRYRTLLWILVSLGVAVVISNGFRFLAQYCISAGSFRAMMDLRRTLYAQVLQLPMSFFTHNVSDLVSRFVQDVQEIQRGLMALFGRLLREPLRAVAVFGVALILNWRVTVIMLAVAPGAILLFWLVGRKIRKANRRLLRAYGTMIGALEATLHAIGITKAYTAEHLERRRLWQIDRTVFRQQLKIAVFQALLKPVLEIVGVVAIMGVAGWLGAKVIRNEIRPEEFFSLLFILGMVFAPLRNIGDLYGRVQRSAAGAQRIFALLDSPVEQQVMEGRIDLPPVRESIEFRSVTFTYPDATAPAVSRVNLLIKSGETVAIVGRNGSGKTTLMNLLLRFYDPQEGEVLLDGRDIRNGSLRTLRQQISLVSQDAVVFAVSMADNIAYGARDASEADIVAAARRAYADEFIRALPQGYATVSGERGMTLSGGQRQRLAIARAILRDAPILIFDEATSQIDAESEAKIQETLRAFAADRTTFIIAHRLSTIKFASRIVVLDEGQVVDIGCHDDLLGRCPLYQVLCQTQLVE